MSNKVRGFALIDAMFGMMFFTLVALAATLWASTEAQKATAKMARERVEFLIEKLQQHYMDRLVVDGNLAADINNYPLNFSKLIELDYINECTDTDAAEGACVDMSVLPWGTDTGEQLVVSRELDANGYPQAKITFNLLTESRVKMQRMFRNQLSMIPDYTEAADGTVTIRVTRPGQALDYENLVSRDGSKDMTGTEWNYGGTATLDNVVDMSFTGLTDRTAITSLMKNGSTRTTTSTGTPVLKPNCPTGYNPTITTYPISIGGSVEYTELGNIDTWWEDTSASAWTVYLRFAGLDIGNDTSRDWHYRGTVGYFTWCDF